MSKNVHFPTLGPKDPQKPTNLHIFSNVGSIYQTKCVHSPNRNPQNYIFSPTQGPKGPQKNLQLTYILKCWQHISNKICPFPKQKPSKLHIFSKCWQHISNKTFIPKCWHHISNIFSNVGSIYPIKYVHSPNRNHQSWHHISNIF